MQDRAKLSLTVILTWADYLFHSFGLLRATAAGVPIGLFLCFAPRWRGGEGFETIVVPIYFEFQYKISGFEESVFTSVENHWMLQKYRNRYNENDIT